MKIDLKEPPRTFVVGAEGQIQIKDMGDIFLQPNEQVTFVTNSGCRHDFVRKNWGFYATPSINGRLKKEGFKIALVENTQRKIYVMVVEQDKLKLFEQYCRDEQQTVLRWLDEDIQ
jgi:hypothetical protein